MHFSIIIPAKNEETNLDLCLQSLHDLDWAKKEYEVLVVDNGSTDGTVCVAKRHGVRVMSFPALSIAALRNRAALSAKGTILAFIDADCTVERDWLSHASRYLDRDDVAGFGSPPLVPERNTWVQRAWFHVRRKRTEGDTEWLESMNLFVRRKSFMQIGGFNERLITCEDYDLSIRIRRIGRLICDERIVAYHHGEASSIPHFFRKEFWRGTANLQGFRCHGFSWRELPSVLLPAVHVLVIILLPPMLVMAWMGKIHLLLLLAHWLFLAWQLPILVLAFYKSRTALAGIHPFLITKRSETGTRRRLPQKDDILAGRISMHLLRMSQLYLLFNVYFTARGTVLLQPFRGAR